MPTIKEALVEVHTEAVEEVTLSVAQALWADTPWVCPWEASNLSCREDILTINRAQT